MNMLFNPKPLGKTILSPNEVKSNLEIADRFEQCAISDTVIFLGTAFKANTRYIPVSDVERVFKRLAVTKGFFEDNKVFASIPYLVLLYDKGSEKQIRFENEEELNQFLASVKIKTNIPVGKE